MIPPLTEKYRPACLDAVVGQPKAVAQLRHFQSRGGFGGLCAWIAGATGTGKTTLARIMAETLADPINIYEFDSADQFNAAAVDEMRDGLYTRGFGRGGKVWIINEAHGLRAGAIRSLLGILERLPAHVAVIFTTTRDGADQLFEDQIDASPLIDRCDVQLNLTTQGLVKAFASRFLEIARIESLDGGADEKAITNLFRELGNSPRRVLKAIQRGALLGAAASEAA